MIRVYKNSRVGTNNSSFGSPKSYTIVTEVPVDDSDDVQIFSPANTSSDQHIASADDNDDDAASVTASIGRTSSDHLQDDTRSLAEREYEERIIWHFLHRNWPEFGVPTFHDLNSFFTLMRLSREKNAPN